MSEVTQGFLSWMQEMGLAPQADGWFIGRLQGFPVGIEAVEPEAETGFFLIQIRHPLTEAESKAKMAKFSEEVLGLISKKGLEISFEDKLIWVSFNNPPARTAEGAVPELFSSILDSLSQAGFAEKLELCHYCRQEPVSELTFANGKIGAICNGCISAKKNQGSKAPEQMGWRLFPWWLPAAGATAVAAVVWLLFWFAWDWCFDAMQVNSVMLPRLVVLVLMVAVGLGVGGPVAWVINRYPFNGKKLPLAFGVVVTTIGVFFGEFLYVMWLVFRELKVISAKAAWSVWWPVETDGAGFYLLYKLIALVVAVIMTFTIVKDQQASDLKL